jgi:hypothetical protein
MKRRHSEQKECYSLIFSTWTDIHKASYEQLTITFLRLHLNRKKPPISSNISVNKAHLNLKNDRKNGAKAFANASHGSQQVGARKKLISNWWVFCLAHPGKTLV